MGDRMKRYQITDGAQIILAIIMTGSMAYAMQPTAIEPAQAPRKVEVVQSTVSKPKAQPEAQETAKNEQIETPAQTWQDNPQKCNQETQYISADAPFNCIDKPAPTANAAPAAAQSVSISGTCSDWMSQAGITHPLARELIARESGCRSTAVNPSSGACGIAQELLEPHQSAEQWAAVRAGYCPKSKCTMQDPVCQLRWMQNYVYGRYGSWEGAIAHHDVKNWY